ncbi:hypothetical protein E2C01_096054 [Portunus trituberculatus]|uniref:Uncharacterized protein n=1 Tax=Portunus trituberculatus TaxID=210409 RepID=A0A5B7JWZ3_PORTR|nr:hypothetical protein [Portunus trituberculatus]
MEREALNLKSGSPNLILARCPNACRPTTHSPQPLMPEVRWLWPCPAVQPPLPHVCLGPARSGDGETLLL